ncbi:hypothetical protein [Alkalibacterium gilvum]|uniref:hypothetical protein n=1 Tax=Alkalibacterium gilvum TaxID=1130080 RepID=UPI003F9386D9
MSNRNALKGGFNIALNFLIIVTILQHPPIGDLSLLWRIAVIMPFGIALGILIEKVNPTDNKEKDSEKEDRDS